MTNDTEASSEDECIREKARLMLRRIGWDPSELQQIDIYNKMSPARKIEQMLRLRRAAIRLLDARLREHYPHATDREIALLRQAELALLED